LFGWKCPRMMEGNDGLEIYLIIIGQPYVVRSIFGHCRTATDIASSISQSTSATFSSTPQVLMPRIGLGVYQFKFRCIHINGMLFCLAINVAPSGPR
jgi:hypothetical protein